MMKGRSHVAAILVLLGSVRGLVADPPTPATERSEGAPDLEPSEPLFTEAREIFEALSGLESPDLERQQESLRFLISTGQTALPYLREFFRHRGLDAPLELFEKLLAQPGTELPKEALLGEQELLRLIEEARTRKGEAQRYLYAKYLEAVESYRQQRYEDALHKVQALLTLEPQLPFGNEVKRLKISLEEALLVSTVLDARVVCDKDLYVVGEVANLTLRLSSRSPEEVRVLLAPPLPDEAPPFVPKGRDEAASESASAHPAPVEGILNIQLSEHYPNGDFAMASRQDRFTVTKDIVLRPPDLWEFSFRLETGKDNPLSPHYRTYRITAQFRPYAVVCGSKEYRRMVTFGPLELRVFPPDPTPVLENPISSLAQALDRGIPNDVFLCSLLVPEREWPKATELLVEALGRAREAEKPVLLNCLRRFTNEPFPLQEDAWKDWVKSFQKKMREKP